MYPKWEYRLWTDKDNRYAEDICWMCPLCILASAGLLDSRPPVVSPSL